MMLFPLLLDGQFFYCQDLFTGGDLIVISNLGVIAFFYL
jgi:hypothetical protein